MRHSPAAYSEVLELFSVPELAWDLHCNISNEIAAEIKTEAKRRGVSLCSVAQARRGGPGFPGMKHTRGACGGCWRSRP
jgi:hypothetical protein